MSKNLTRKSLAIISGFALAAAGTVPATAAVDDSQVSLLPRTGTQYSIPVDNVFDLRSDVSVSAVAGSGNLKFLVTDPSERIHFDYDEDTASNSDTLASAVAITDWAATDGTGTTLDTVTLTFGAALGVEVDDVITIASFAGTTDGTAAAATGVVSAINGTKVVSAVSGATVSYRVPAATFTGNIASSAATATAGTATELTLTDGLDTRANIITASGLQFATAGLTGLTAPARAVNGSFVVDTGDDDEANTDILRLVSTGTTAYSATVTAWVDVNGNGEIDLVEPTSSTRTVNFVPWANAGVVLDLEQPIAGQSTWKANIKLDSAINASQITASRLAIGVGVIEAGALLSGASGVSISSNAFSAGVAATYSSVNNYWGLGTSGTAGVATVINYASGTDDIFRAGFSYTAQVLLDGSVFSSSISKTTGSALADAVGAVSAALGDNVRVISGQNYAVRSTTKSITATAKVTKNSVAVANAPVVVTVTRNVLDVDSTITVGGRTLTSTTTGGSVSYDAVTDAAGVVTINIANSQGKAADKVTVSVSQAGIASSGTTTFEWLAVDNSAARVGSTSSAGEDRVGITRGGSYTINYVVADQFGAAITSNWRLLIEYTPIGNVAGLAQDPVVRSVPVTGSIVPVTITDTSTIVGTYNVTAKLQRLVANTGNFDTAVDTQTTTVHVQSNVTPAAITVSETAVGTPALETKDFKAVDLRANRNQELPGYSADGYTISGVVTNSAGSGLAGVNVTVSANGAAFFEDGPDQTSASRDVYGVGSIVVTTNANGAYTVRLYSQRSGKFKVTATIGALTATTTNDLSFPATAQTAGAALTVNAPANVLPGSTFQVTAKLVDKWGNGVPADDATSGIDVAVSYTGPGIVFGQLPTKFDANGNITFSVLLGSNDRGSATVVVSYDGDTTSATNTNAFTVTRSIIVGTSGSTGTGKVNVGSFNGKLVVYAAGLNGARISWKVGGNWGSQVAASNYAIFNRPTPRAGVTVSVDIYVNGVKTLTKSVVTR